MIPTFRMKMHICLTLSAVIYSRGNCRKQNLCLWAAKSSCILRKVLSISSSEGTFYASFVSSEKKSGLHLSINIILVCILLLFSASGSNIFTRTPNTLSSFSSIVIPPQSHPYTSILRMGTSERHKGAQLRITTIFLSREVMHNVLQQLNNMMTVMSPTPDSWGNPTYTQ